MCDDCNQHIAWEKYQRVIEQIAMEIPTQQNELNLPQADDIRIGDEGPVMRRAGATVELVSMRFGAPPANPKGGPVFNFRSEGHDFADSKRCLILASAFFVFTGTQYPKTKYPFTLNRAPFMAVAGLWREGEGDQPPSFTMVDDMARTRCNLDSQSPGRRSAPCQLAALAGDLTKSESGLLQPLPAGSLHTEIVRKGAT
jgi:putative SOS response-associated peptidase YedK